MNFEHWSCILMLLMLLISSAAVPQKECRLLAESFQIAVLFPQKIYVLPSLYATDWKISLN